MHFYMIPFHLSCPRAVFPFPLWNYVKYCQSKWQLLLRKWDFSHWAWVGVWGMTLWWDASAELIEASLFPCFLLRISDAFYDHNCFAMGRFLYWWWKLHVALTFDKYCWPCTFSVIANLSFFNNGYPHCEWNRQTHWSLMSRNI